MMNLSEDPEASFLIGEWEWVKTKFVQSSAPLLVRYKKSQYARDDYRLQFFENGQLHYLKNGEVYKQYQIMTVQKIQNIEVNSLVIHLDDPKQKAGIEIQRLYGADRINFMYAFPYSKQVGGSYNWFVLYHYLLNAR